MMPMRSIRNLSNYPAGRPLTADDVLEFHAARLLLLLHLCGKDGEIDGLTKLAKLDFFVRYPAFFARACEHLKRPTVAVDETIEASMVRHRYGPWDHRYYHLLAYLEATDAIEVQKSGAKSFRFALTEPGTAAAARLASRESFLSLRDHMIRVRKVLGSRNGDSLKRLIYSLFQKEVAERPLGDVIR
jgi:hypothetical protein